MAEKEKSKMSKFVLTLILMGVLTVVGYAMGVIVAHFLLNKTIQQAFTDMLALILAGIGLLGGFILGLSIKTKKKSTSKNEGETAKGEKIEIQHDSSFMTEDQLKNNSDPSIIYTTWDKLPSLDKTGFVFRHKVKGNKFEINMKHETHSLVIGTTGTGKTQVLADPTIRILAHSKEKPSMVLADPKGELYEDNYNILKEEGYDVQVLNLDNPYISSRWNPMELAWNTYERAGNLAKEVKKISGCTPQEAGYKTFPEEELGGRVYGDTWYAFQGKAYPDNEILKEELEAVKAQLEAEAKATLRNIGIALIPVPPDTKEPMWLRGSQDLIVGIMEAMLEDSRDPRLGMTKDKFNFYNLYKIAMHRDSNGTDSQIETLKHYSEGRDPRRSSVHDLMATICGTSPTTQKSFLGTLGSSLGLFADEGILYLTSATDINFEKMTEKPTAFFIRSPDHKPERHPLTILCISQLYKVLVDVANRTINPKTGKAGTLNRKVYYILDEFGNLPAIENFGTMVTVSRSRNIFFEIILQSYKQLDIKYGADEAQNIRGNFQMELFLGSEDASTIQAFSDACGEITVFTNEESESKTEQKDSNSTTKNKSVQRTRRPLIDKQELRTLPKFTVIAKLFRQPIMKEQMTIFALNDNFRKSPAQAPTGLAKKLDVDNIAYDIEKRNKIVLKPSSPFDF